MVASRRDQHDRQDDCYDRRKTFNEKQSKKTVVDNLNTVEAAVLAQGDALLENVGAAAMGTKGPADTGETEQEVAEEKSSGQVRVSCNACCPEEGCFPAVGKAADWAGVVLHHVAV